ncbi:MAG: NAD-dependent 4,6-dehydratase LegB [Candidatus Cloacimonetes bacterium]|nr:NAD-dependent 4,6-dehydratase LegB [Candidatus Cloacimonadota bacterium]
MKKTLVTGAGGFIGSHLVELLIEKGYNVRAFVRYNSKNDWGWLEESSYRNNIEVVTGDIRDYDSVCAAVHGCNQVFHLAALIGIPYSYISPLAYIKTNIEGTYNILQSCRQEKVDNIMITSTSETYGSAQYVPIDETHPMVGQSPYSASKIGADHLALSYWRSFNLPVKIVRPFNTYGPRQSARAIIPTVITQILSGKKLLKLGNLHPTRDLTFVQDTVAGFEAISRSSRLNGEITNIGMNHEISIGDMVNLIVQLCNTEIEIQTDTERVRPDKSEVERLYCANEKILSNTDWKPAYTLKSGLMETIAFLKDNLCRYKPEIYNV